MMAKVLALPAVSIVAALSMVALPRAQAPTLDDLRYLTGAWMAQVGAAEMEEHWIAPAGGTMFGVSRTVSGGRTVEFEFLRLEERADGIYYVVQPNGRAPTEFKLTRHTRDEIVFENPEHDFPQIIRYARQGEGSLQAEIEGDQGGRRVKQTFAFSRLVR